MGKATSVATPAANPLLKPAQLESAAMRRLVAMPLDGLGSVRRGSFRVVATAKDALVVRLSSETPPAPSEAIVWVGQLRPLGLNTIHDDHSPRSRRPAIG
ncbi:MULTISPECIES: hypothetical protein [unclassified Kribbella]|uniref:hypothetical protein n=1 Tax=unclassified Kribbella TaxID=2644121 RepID=UPI0033DE01E3